MKNLILLSALFYHCSLFAQQGFFVQPEIGAGITNATVFVFNEDNHNETKASYKSKLHVGYQFKHIIFKTGISYFNTGRLYEYVFRGGIGPENNFANQYNYNYYLAIPISAAYVAKLSSHLSLAPCLGYSLGFARVRETIFTEQHRTVDYKDRGTNSFASLQLELSYKLSSRFCLTLTPDAQYMVPTNLARNVDLFDTHTGYLANYTYTLNFGLRYYLTRQAKKVKNEEAPKVPDAKPVLEKGEGTEK